MHESGDLLPDSSELLQLHQRLIDSDPTAPSDMAAIFLESLILWLQEHNRGIDPDLCSEAAGEAIISLIQKPASYRPELLELPAYLRMSAQRDLQNVLRRELKHHAQCRSLDCVEHSPDAGKYFGRDDDPSLPAQIAEQYQAQVDSVPLSVRQGLSEVESRVLPLLLCKERKTATYAEAIGITHLPLKDQRKEVKLVKDRLLKPETRGGRAMSEHLERLARRVASDPFFLASVLVRYAASEELDDSALAAKLGCPMPILTRLRLCRVPRPEAPFFWQDVELIAAHFALDLLTLADVVRRGQALLTLQQAARKRPDDAKGVFLAARDGVAEPDDPPKGDGL